MSLENDWSRTCDAALRVLDHDIRHEAVSSGGLHEYQHEIVRHVVNALSTRPGLVIAERTGRGKSVIATAVIAALASARAREGGEPFRVGLLAPNADVLENWVGDSGLLRRTLDDPKSAEYLWRDEGLPWRLVCARPWLDDADPDPRLEVFTHHYSRGITNGFGTWGKDAKARRRHAAEFLRRKDPAPLDLLIVDEAHQLRTGGSDRVKAVEAIFGGSEPAIPVRRVLLLTATPFQLRAAPELARLVRMLRWPRVLGVDFPPDLVARTTPQAVSDLFERYQRVVCQWLMLRMSGLDAEQSYRDAQRVRGDVESVLRPLIVRMDAPSKHVHTGYGQPDPSRANHLPDPGAGLCCENLEERLLFLAWDGSIASRTTFVAAEQQTLTSSAEALRKRHDEDGGASAVEQKRRPLAPQSVQDALFRLSDVLAEKLEGEHVKVEATIRAVADRLAHDPARRPILVFAERTATLHMLRDRLSEALAPRAKVEVIDGTVKGKARTGIVERFHASDPDERVHVILASKVAEMGLDIDGPEDKDDIWLIHHDFPWNPATVDQRNGRVCRPAKKVEARPVHITYPFIRDTVDERIFKRMLARQAMAELLLGTDDVARALRLTDQTNLDKMSCEAIAREELRALSPNLAPTVEGVPPAAAVIEAIEQPEADAGARPSWCPLELLDLVDARFTSTPTDVLRERVAEMADELGVVHWQGEKAVVVRVEMAARRQSVAVLLHDDLVETISLADTEIDDERIVEAFARNAEPGAAGLMLLEDSRGQERIVARAANLAGTLDDSELRRLLWETGRRADDWEAHHHGGLDQW